MPLERVRLQQAGLRRHLRQCRGFVGFLPFHADDREPGQESITFRGARWMTLKLARELGINITGGSTSVADAWMPLRLAAATRARAARRGVIALEVAGGRTRGARRHRQPRLGAACALWRAGCASRVVAAGRCDVEGEIGISRDRASRASGWTWPDKCDGPRRLRPRRTTAWPGVRQHPAAADAWRLVRHGGCRRGPAAARRRARRSAAAARWRERRAGGGRTHAPGTRAKRRARCRCSGALRRRGCWTPSASRPPSKRRRAMRPSGKGASASTGAVTARPRWPLRRSGSRLCTARRISPTRRWSR